MIQWVVATDDAPLAQGLGEFLAHSVPGEWVENNHGTHLECTLSSSDDNREERAWPLARALAHYLLVSHERDWLDALLTHRYRVFDALERQEIINQAGQLLHSDQDQEIERLDLAATLLFHFIAAQPRLVIEGIRTFLMADIRVEFEEAIDQAVDAHLMEQEYQEFVHLLQRMVKVATNRHEWIHVRFSDARFFFEDISGLRLADELVDDMLEGIDTNHGGLDEVLISALVTLAPRRITIHGGQLAAQGRETLLRVFDGRVLFCRGCGRCFAAHVDSDWRSF